MNSVPHACESSELSIETIGNSVVLASDHWIS